MAKQKLILFALALLVATFSSLLPAQSSSIQQTAMSWPMQQGESLNDVARLFYPKNRYMQRQFVVAAIKLNQDTQPDLKPNMAFLKESTIIIPDIKALSSKSPPKVAQAKVERVTVVADAVISTKLQAEYEKLVQRNTLFKLELDKLNVKLARLEQVFTALKVELMRLIETPVPAAPAPVAIEAASQPSVQQQASAATEHEPTVKQLPVAQVNEKPVSQSGDKARAPDFYLWLSLLTVLFVVGLFAGLMFYTRKQTEKSKVAATSAPATVSKNAFIETILSIIPSTSSRAAKTQPLVVQSEFSGSISDAEPVVNVLHEKEDAELMLEQAKIYVNLGRHEDAIKLLSAHIQLAPTAALQHWLYLLDIYRDTDQKEAFEESAKQLHQTFNVVMPQWEKISTVDEFFAPPHTLEEYDYIVDKVTKLWADCGKEADKLMQTKNYLDKLLTDTRNHERTGFSMDVFEDIVLLREMLDAREKLAKEV